MLKSIVWEYLRDDRKQQYLNRKTNEFHFDFNRQIFKLTSSARFSTRFKYPNISRSIDMILWTMLFNTFKTFINFIYIIFHAFDFIIRTWNRIKFNKYKLESICFSCLLRSGVELFDKLCPLLIRWINLSTWIYVDIFVITS